MSSINWIRWGSGAAFLAGVSFVLLSLLSLAISGSFSYLDAGFVVAWLLTVPGIVGLHAAQKERYGMLGRVGSLSSVGGVVANTLGFLPLLAGNESLLWLGFPVGALLLLIGLVAMGIATLRAGVLPRLCGVVLIVALPLTVIASEVLGVEGNRGDYPGVVVMGLVWLVLGYALWSMTTRNPVSAS